MTASRFVLIRDHTLSGRLLAGDEVEIAVSIEIEQLDAVELDAFGTADRLPNPGLSREKNTGLFAVGVLTGDDEGRGDEQEKKFGIAGNEKITLFCPVYATTKRARWSARGPPR